MFVISTVEETTALKQTKWSTKAACGSISQNQTKICELLNSQFTLPPAFQEHIGKFLAMPLIH